MTVYQHIKGSIVAMVTPMQPNGDIDWPAWDHLLQWHAASGTSSVVVAGTTGESACLKKAELLQLTQRAVELFGPHGSVIMGIGSPGTAKSMDLLRIAEQARADAVLAVTPYYNRPPQAGLRQHYAALADNTALPIIVYNVPGRTGVDLQPETFAALKQHANIIGLKEANAEPGRLAALLNLPGRSVSILSGDDPTACASLQAGASGVISVAANVAPGSCAELYRLALAGEAEQANRLDSQLQDLYEFLGCCSNPIPAKWYLERLGKIQRGIRLPLVWLPRELEQYADRIYEQYRNIEDPLPTA